MAIIFIQICKGDLFCLLRLWIVQFELFFILGFQRDRTTPRFSGMNLGDVMKVTVMKEMSALKMSNNKPLDLSDKPLNMSKKFWPVYSSILLFICTICFREGKKSKEFFPPRQVIFTIYNKIDIALFNEQK